MQGKKSWLEISEQHLRHNYNVLLRAAANDGQDVSVVAVVKARAYGHGADLCAPVLASAGAPWLGVTDAEEGAAVRRSLNLTLGSDAPQPAVLVMCGLLPGDAETIAANKLTPVVWTADHLDWLAANASPVPVHLEIDTGMSRQGVTPGASLDRFLDRLASAPNLRLRGVLTHFASAEISSSPLTALQQQRFETALAQIAARGRRPDWIHAGNSSTVDEVNSLPWLRRIAAHHQARPLVRSGLALYGYALPLEGAESTLRESLRPVLTWKSRILSLQHISTGATIGYNGTFTAPAPMRIALLPVGYADGLRRELSATNTRPGGWACVGGQRAPIVGRVSMNLTTIDVTHIPDAAIGDVVTLLGEGITADDHARLARTIPYEILCGLRAPRQLAA